jgi:small-conductance mechanosensitive channel/CRP-like cAMP-binding protein
MGSCGAPIVSWLEGILAEASAVHTVWLALAAVLMRATMLTFVPKGERRTGFMVSLVVLHLALLPLGGWFRSVAGRDNGEREVHFLLVVSAAMVAVGVGAHVLFDLVLPRISLRAPRILRDLSVAGASLVALFGVASRLGFNLSGIIATSAVVTAVIGFSLQDTLGNIMGGLALQLDNSIGVGDWIKVGDVTGRVTEIRWRYTAVETRNWETVIFPNSQLMKGQVMILGRRSGQPQLWRRWVWFTVDYVHPPAAVIEAVRSALLAAPVEGMATEPPPNIVLMEFSDSGCRYAIRYMLTDIARDDPTDGNVRQRVYLALKRLQVEFSVASHNVHLHLAPSREEASAAAELEKRREALASMDLFRDLDGDARERIASVLRAAPFGAGEVLTRQGNVAHWLYVICSGEVSVRITVDGQEREVSRIAGPAFVGEMGVLTGQPRTATIVAATDVDCYRLDKSALQHVLDARPDLAGRLSELLTQRRIELEAAREGVSAESRAQRVQASQSEILGKIRTFFGLAG